MKFDCFLFCRWFTFCVSQKELSLTWTVKTILRGHHSILCLNYSSPTFTVVLLSCVSCFSCCLSFFILVKLQTDTRESVAEITFEVKIYKSIEFHGKKTLFFLDIFSRLDCLSWLSVCLSLCSWNDESFPFVLKKHSFILFVTAKDKGILAEHTRSHFDSSSKRLQRSIRGSERNSEREQMEMKEQRDEHDKKIEIFFSLVSDVPADSLSIIQEIRLSKTWHLRVCFKYMFNCLTDSFV